MQYRLLRSDEWERLNQVMLEEYIPRPEYSMVAIAEDENGAITGCLPLQLALHLEPLTLMSPKVSFKRLYETIMENVENKGAKFYSFSDQEVVGRMAEHVGMKEVPLKVYEGEIK